jgi:hypothetical protein
MEYKSLKRYSWWSKFIKDEKALKELVDMETAAKKDIELLINKPKNATLWKEFGYVVEE